MSDVVVVTGAGKGIGRAIVRRFARPGVSLGLLGRGEEALEAARAEAEQAGARALAIPTDVSDAQAVEAAAAAVGDQLGGIDVWVNNAMTTVFAFFQEIKPEGVGGGTRVPHLRTGWGTRARL